ncbi:MAG: hypothetical protein KDD65_05545 [Bacteroidetes bacterium]|nr:hypothetical protein [Bacteroidota bacterium]
MEFSPDRPNNLLLGLILIGLTVLTGCDGVFPSAPKYGPPADHTVSKSGALHKAGLKNPTTAEAGCSAAECHHSDLRGGMAIVENELFVAPSCYQCHGEKWNERDAPSSYASVLDTVSVIRTRENNTMHQAD